MIVLSELRFEADIVALTPGQSVLWGFRSGDQGIHTSRTIMLDELSHLLEAVPGPAAREEYVEAVTAHNCLEKRTVSTRKLTLQRLTELYALNPQVILFRVLRDLWERNEKSRPFTNAEKRAAREQAGGK